MVAISPCGSSPPCRVTDVPPLLQKEGEEVFQVSY